MKPIFSSKNVKSLHDLIIESENLKENPEVNYWIAVDGAEITKYKYPNGLWKKEIRKNSRIVIRYSAKIGNKIVITEYVETNFSLKILENMSIEIADMFSQYEHSKIWIK
jgi:hypothetical protein